MGYVCRVYDLNEISMKNRKVNLYSFGLIGWVGVFKHLFHFKSDLVHVSFISTAYSTYTVSFKVSTEIKKKKIPASTINARAWLCNKKNLSEII